MTDNLCESVKVNLCESVMVTVTGMPSGGGGMCTWFCSVPFWCLP